MKILLVTGESLPYAKSGGLGDFVFSYAKALAKLGEDVSVILPLYLNIRRNYGPVMQGFYDQFDFNMGGRTQGCGVFHEKREGVDFYFTAMDRFDREEMYGYGDDKERFACFMMAVNTFITRHNDYDVVHCNDWQTAVLPVLLTYNPKKIKTVLTIHNPAYQGWATRDDLMAYFNLQPGYYDSGYVRLGDSFNYLKTGIMSADKINTVSKTHAQELLNDHTGFGGLGAIIDWCRHYDFSGIVNGLDTEIWDPKTDTHIAKTYDYSTYKEAKAVNKKALFHLLGMDENFTGALFGAVTRLSQQKGVDRILSIMPHLHERNAKMVIVGTGEMEGEVLAQALKYPDVYFAKRYDENLAHLVYAASDFFLMPSYFEPCGTSQMIAMRYASVPIVSNVGGLNDTVFDVTKGNIANGFTFYNSDPYGCLNAYFRAMDLYDHKALDPLIKVGMEGDYSWAKSAKQYLDLYHSIDWK